MKIYLAPLQAQEAISRLPPAYYFFLLTAVRGTNTHKTKQQNAWQPRLGATAEQFQQLDDVVHVVAASHHFLADDVAAQQIVIVAFARLRRRWRPEGYRNFPTGATAAQRRTGVGSGVGRAGVRSGVEPGRPVRWFHAVAADRG